VNPRRRFLQYSTTLISLLVLALSSAKAAELLPLSTEPSKLSWIGSTQPLAKDATAVFEREFQLANAPVVVRIKLMSSAPCKVTLNGESVGEHSDVKRPKVFEFKKQAVKGVNKLRLETKSSGGADSLVMSMLVADMDGTRRRLETNGAWSVVVKGKAEPAKVLHDYATASQGDVFVSLRPSVTAAEDLKVPEGFRVERLHALDEDEGSWVAMCFDGKGRIIASDAGGRLVRVTVPAIGGDPKATKIEPINLPVGHANGLLWAFDSLYVMVCQEGVYEAGSGVYRLRDTDGDDVFDKVELLRKLIGQNDHGPHALILTPDGKSITVVCGNATAATEYQHYQVPPIWKDDLALPKIKGHGFMLGAGAPAGYFCRMSPDGKEWTLIAEGFRNEYDAAYNRDGELFTYDADMEWDLGTPWYRPTRVCHVVDGAEYGWRSVSGKWPEDYADSLPPVLNVGQGSPTGVAFGYGGKFPLKYQEALYIADWTYGRLYAVHMKEKGASYSANMEVFVEGRGLKPTDIAVNKKDGAMYFTGGSRTGYSGLFRLYYTGKESTAEAPPKGDPKTRELRALRHRLEQNYNSTDAESLNLALANLAHEDRFIRFAARTLLEFRPVAEWQKQALLLDASQAVVQSALALSRLETASAKSAVFEKLATIDLAKQPSATKLDVIRALQVASIRLGDPDAPARATLLNKLHTAVPTTDNRFNIEAGQLLVRWKSPLAAQKLFPLFQKAPTQEEQIAFAAVLRLVSGGWPAGSREIYFRWFLRAEFNKAGNLAKFTTDIRNDAIACLSREEQTALEKVLSAPPEVQPAPPVASRLFVKNWSTDELAAEVEPLLKGKRNIERGKTLFRETGCLACHLFKSEGGVVGPDLTLAAQKFGLRELIESITEPSKTISDQYGTTQVTMKNGDVFVGRKVNEGPDALQIQENIFTASDVRSFVRKDIQKVEVSSVSLMPPGLINTCHPDEVADLIAWLQAGAK
jgi:putative heme-binding domain-containing protein